MTSKRKDTILSLVTMFLALVFMVCIPYQTEIKPILGAQGHDIINGAFFPKISAALLFLSGILMLIITSITQPNDEADRKPLFEKNEIFLLVMITALGFGYVKLIALINYPIATVVILSIMMVLTKAGNWFMIIFYSIAASLLIYYAFTQIFYIPLH